MDLVSALDTSTSMDVSTSLAALVVFATCDLASPTVDIAHLVVDIAPSVVDSALLQATICLIVSSFD